MAKKESILFSVSRNGETRGYVLGTMHVQDRRAFRYLDVITSLIMESEVFYAETDIDDMQSMSSRMMYLEDGKTLSDFLSQKKIKKISKICTRAFNIDISQMLNLRPMYLVNVLTMQVLSNDMALPLDHYLWNFAKQHDIPRMGVETAEEQAAIFQQIPIKWQVKQLKEVVKNIGKFRKEVIRLTGYYEDMRLNKLYRLSKKQLGGMRSVLLYDRNEVMIKRILDALDQGKPFISVGASHLPGKKGILRALKQADYRLSAL